MFIFRPVATREIRKSLCFNPRLLLFAPLLISLASSPVFSQDCWQLYTYCSQYGGQYCTDFQNLCQPFWPYDYCGCMAARHDEYFCHQFCAYTVCTCVELCPVQSVDVSGPASLIIGGEDGMYQAMPSPGFGSGFWEWSLSNPFAGSLSPAFSSPTFYPIAPPSATLVEATFHPSDAYCPDVTGWTPVVTDCPAYSVSIDGPPAAVAGGNDETFSASVYPPLPGVFQWSLSNPQAGSLSPNGSQCTFSPGDSGQQQTSKSLSHLRSVARTVPPAL